MKINNKPESPKADRATLDKVGKILPLLNSNNPAEAHAAAAALAQYDMRDVAASLEVRTQVSRLDDFLDQWRDEKRNAMQLRLDELQKQARVMLDETSPLLTKVMRRGLQKIVQLGLSENESLTQRNLDYWGRRLFVIRWQTTPGAKELENALGVAACHSQSAKNSMHGVFNATARVRLVETVATAKAALIKAEEQIAKVPVNPQRGPQ